MKLILPFLLFLFSDLSAQLKISGEDSLRKLAYSNVRTIRNKIDSTFLLTSYDSHGDSNTVTMKVILSYDMGNNLIKAEKIFSSQDSLTVFYFNKGDFLFMESIFNDDVSTWFMLLSTRNYMSPDTNLVRTILQNIRTKYKNIKD